MVLFLLHPVVDFSLYSHYQILGWIFFFSYFGSSFLLYCLTISRDLLGLPSFANIFWFLFFFFLFFFSSCIVPLIHGCLWEIFSFHWVCVRFIFLSSFIWRSFFICPIFIYRPRFVSLFNSFGGCLFYHQLALLLHRLTRSVRWCYLAGYISIIYLLFRSLTWLFFSSLYS